MFDEIYSTAVVPSFQNVFGTTAVVYRHAMQTKSINVTFGVTAKTILTDESGNQQTVELATIHIPIDATNGISDISTRAIVEQGAKIWSIEEIVDMSPSMATVTGRRLLVHEHSQRNRK